MTRPTIANPGINIDIKCPKCGTEFFDSEEQNYSKCPECLELVEVSE